MYNTIYVYTPTWGGGIRLFRMIHLSFFNIHRREREGADSLAGTCYSGNINGRIYLHSRARARVDCTWRVPRTAAAPSQPRVFFSSSSSFLRSDDSYRLCFLRSSSSRSSLFTYIASLSLRISYIIHAVYQDDGAKGNALPAFLMIPRWLGGGRIISRNFFSEFFILHLLRIFGPPCIVLMLYWF